MSSKPTKGAGKQSAEVAFRNAYERLKTGRPIVLPKNTPVSQNNVAKEAGVDPTALKKSRFPSLISEIQHYVAEHGADTPVSARQVMLKQRRHRRGLKAQIFDSSVQRDHLASLLNKANGKIVELTNRVLELEAKLPPSNVTDLAGRKMKRL
ncbi:hypothetical protein [Polaromonas sp. LjRoot131]|uniref:hypothetical protein n=1 Tax=Polaromonas sp. LjRoot131 TaxID=3342262 RepID=UPI003ECD635C